jgi:nucleoside-diphosphate-sugar epimerase
MGSKTVEYISKNLTNIHLKLLVRDSKNGRKMMDKYSSNPDIEIIWGDFLDYDTVLKCVQGSNYVIHIGGLVSPYADRRPYETLRVNVGSALLITKAVLAQPNADDIKVCYIGSVAETGDRNYPIHWGRVGDPIQVSIYDHYGVSKVIAERVFIESGIKNWVVLRQSGIIHAGLFHHIEPIAFDVPLNGVLEWATVEDSAILMDHLVRYDLPDSFWCNIYNIGSGEQYRLTNYEFETLILKSIGLGPLEVTFDPHWFATQNFHGHFYADSNTLENYLHFRQNIPVDDYFKHIGDQCEFYLKIPRYIPFKSFLGFFVKPFMEFIANTKVFGTQNWIKTRNMNRISSFYGSYESYSSLPKKWKDFKIEHYNTSDAVAINYRLDHGYDENKPIKELDIEDMKQAAHFRGGECLSKSMVKGDMRTKLLWKCGHCGKTFLASPTLILLGGHWCPHCYVPHTKWDYDSIAKTNPFFAQVWYPHHPKNSNFSYTFDNLFVEPQWIKTKQIFYDMSDL